MIKFEHTLFALPFAFLGAILAANGLPSWQQLVWITVAMAGLTTETTIRVIRKLAKKGVLNIDHGKIIIDDDSNLKRLVES